MDDRIGSVLRPARPINDAKEVDVKVEMAGTGTRHGIRPLLAIPDAGEGKRTSVQ